VVKKAVPDLLVLKKAVPDRFSDADLLEDHLPDGNGCATRAR
jgi:hypothetical protein